MSDIHSGIGETINEVADELVEAGEVTELGASDIVDTLIDEVFGE